MQYSVLSTQHSKILEAGIPKKMSIWAIRDNVDSQLFSIQILKSTKSTALPLSLQNKRCPTFFQNYQVFVFIRGEMIYYGVVLNHTQCKTLVGKHSHQKTSHAMYYDDLWPSSIFNFIPPLLRWLRYPICHYHMAHIAAYQLLHILLH